MSVLAVQVNRIGEIIDLDQRKKLRRNQTFTVLRSACKKLHLPAARYCCTRNRFETSSLATNKLAYLLVVLVGSRSADPPRTMRVAPMHVRGSPQRGTLAGTERKIISAENSTDLRERIIDRSCVGFSTDDIQIKAKANMKMYSSIGPDIPVS